MKDIMRAFFGFTLFCVGLLAVAMGVWGIFSNSGVIGGFLVFGGNICSRSFRWQAPHIPSTASATALPRKLATR